MNYKDFKRKTRGQDSITITAIYKTQIGLYQYSFLKLFWFDQKQIQACTVDTIQRYKNNTIFLDLVNSFRPGYTNKLYCLNIVLTQARYLLVVVFNFCIIYNNSKVVCYLATKKLFKLFDYTCKKNLIINITIPEVIYNIYKTQSYTAREYLQYNIKAY